MSLKAATAYNAPREQWLGTGQLNGYIDIPNGYYRPTLAYDPTINQEYSPGYLDGYYRNWYNRYSNWMRTTDPQPQAMFRHQFVVIEDDLSLEVIKAPSNHEEPRLNSPGHYLPRFNTNIRRGGIRSNNRLEFKPLQLNRIAKNFDYTPRSLSDNHGQTFTRDFSVRKKVYDKDEQEGEDGLYGYNQTAQQKNLTEPVVS